jgi:hypothetical protein
LSSANLQKSNLKRAVLIEAVLSGADLRGADLTGAMLRGAFLGGDINPSLGENLPIVKFDKSTRLPSGEYWDESVDITRYTDYKHPEFWLFQNEISPE